jgi:CRP-like cAMP-binding protein
MRALPLPVTGTEAAVARLGSLAPLRADEAAALMKAASTPLKFATGREIIAEGQSLAEPRILLEGWGCRLRIFSDGRRQILGFVLPGDLIGFARSRDAISSTAIGTLTNVLLCRAPEPEQAGEGLALAYAHSLAAEKSYLYRHAARLGRMSAYERMVDFFLEMEERLASAGLATAGTFPLPITQEVLADTLGLTSVHVNRTLQTLRREGLIEWHGGIARLRDPEQLRQRVEYRPVLAHSR